MTDGALTILWQFTAKAGKEQEFEEVYGAAGDWARLFRKADGYLGSELYRSRQGPRRYLVIDRWRSPDAFERFRISWGEQYRALDKRCEELTEQEAHLGDFSQVPPRRAR